MLLLDLSFSDPCHTWMCYRVSVFPFLFGIFHLLLDFFYLKYQSSSFQQLLNALQGFEDLKMEEYDEHKFENMDFLVRGFFLLRDTEASI